MSVAYVIMCDDESGCGETAWASPTMDGYRRALRREGWASSPPQGDAPRLDFCPEHVRREEVIMGKSEYGTSGGVELTDELIERLAREQVA